PAAEPSACDVGRSFALRRRVTTERRLVHVAAERLLRQRPRDAAVPAGRVLGIRRTPPGTQRGSERPLQSTLDGFLRRRRPRAGARPAEHDAAPLAAVPLRAVDGITRAALAVAREPSLVFPAPSARPEGQEALTWGYATLRRRGA